MTPRIHPTAIVHPDARLADDVEVGPWAYIGPNCSIGAGSVIGCDLTVGRFAMVGMGAVVTRSVAPFHLVTGHPARPVGIVSRAGEPLLRFSGAKPPDRELLTCPSSGLRYAIRGGVVAELDPPS